MKLLNNGEPFAITQAGESVVETVPPPTSDARQVQRTGFLVGQIQVPDDFDRMGADEIKSLFGCGE